MIVKLAAQLGVTTSEQVLRVAGLCNGRNDEFEIDRVKFYACT